MTVAWTPAVVISGYTWLPLSFNRSEQWRMDHHAPPRMSQVRASGR